MIAGGNTTVRVSDMDAAIRFYTGTLGLRLTHRLGSRWATIEAGASYWTTDAVGAGLVIGLQPRTESDPPAGTTSAVMFGLETVSPIEQVASDLRTRHVDASDVIRTEIGNFVSIQDMDGNPIYLWEIVPGMLSETRGGGGENGAAAEASGHFFGGHANIYVSNMDRAIAFYVDVLGLPLTNRFGRNWATVEAGRSLVIGIHPETPKYPRPGTRGATLLGLTLDEPIDRVVARLVKQGVRMAGSVSRSEEASVVRLEDPDGNLIELREAAAIASPEPVTAAASRV